MTLRYFNIDWQSADAAAQRHALAAYWQQLEDLARSCPPAIIEFARGHTLHDGQLVDLDIHLVDHVAVMRIQGWNPKFDEPRLYTLLYRELESFREVGPEDSIGRRIRSIDASYDEFHPSGTGAYEHRVAFHSEIEFCFVFRDFAFQYEVTKI